MNRHVFFAGAVWLSACVPDADPAPATPPIDRDTLTREVEAWHAGRLADLERPDGWLSLVGLFWLEGDHTFGPGEDNAFRFPPGAPTDRLGVFELRDSTVLMRLSAGVVATFRGDSVTELEMTPTQAEFPEDMVRLNSLAWHLIRRNGRYAIRLKDSLAKPLVQFDGVDRFPVETRWHLPARFERYDPPKPVQIPNYMGYVTEQTSPGAVVFEINGNTYRLDVTGSPGDSAFFIPFGDETNGVNTYGGGRFIWVDGPDNNGRTVIDLNRSYNPPCVFSAFATCPLPPHQNRLAVRIDAGELQYRAPGH